jgi:MGT family glycosyltransferase
MEADVSIIVEGVPMNRRHFAVLTQLGNGHVYPVLPLCMELAKRGHRVTYITNDHYAPMIVESGAEPILFKNRQMSEQIREETRIGLGLPFTDPRLKKMLKSWRMHSFADATELLPQVEKFYQENVPDLILYDRYNIAGRVLAKRLDVPTVQVSAHFAFYNDLAMRRNGVCENPDAIVEWSKDLDSFLSTYGITSQGNYWHVENLNIHFIPKEFQHHSDCFDERFCFVGALLNRRFHPMWTDRSNTRPVILISGMSMWNDTKIDYSGYFCMLIDALSGLPYHCILSIGDDKFSPELPPNFELNRRASHLEILPYAALLICHGGMTSTLEAIYHGVPVLMIPASEACDEVAYRAEELGLGVRLANDVLSVENVRKTVSEMLQDISLLNRVTHMRDVFRGSGGADLAANRIEDYLVNCKD